MKISENENNNKFVTNAINESNFIKKLIYLEEKIILITING